MLDPIVAIRQEIILDPDQTATIDLVTGAAAARDTAEHLVERYQDRHLADRVFDLAWTHNQVVLQQFGISEAEAQEYERLAGSMIFANASLRADAGVIVSAIAAVSRDCGATRSPATCRSCCCRSRIWPTSASSASSCRPARTGE